MSTDPRKVFVVYGRNGRARRAIFDFLRAIDLEPIEWSQAVSLTGKASPFIGEVLDLGFNVAQAVVIILTGDDEAKLKSQFISDTDPDYEKCLTPQARPNVIFEAGMAFGKYPDRTIIVEIGHLRPFSDINGRHSIRLTNSSKGRQELAQRLKNAGCIVNISGTDWHDAGNFDFQDPQ